MTGYLIRRVALLIPTMFLVTILLFLVVRLMPGSVIELMAQQHMQEQSTSMELNTELLRHMIGLDKPVLTQYVNWVKGILPNQGD